jgi:hypothetical protein
LRRASETHQDSELHDPAIALQNPSLAMLSMLFMLSMPKLCSSYAQFLLKPPRSLRLWPQEAIQGVPSASICIHLPCVLHRASRKPSGNFVGARCVQESSSELLKDVDRPSQVQRKELHLHMDHCPDNRFLVRHQLKHNLVACPRLSIQGT